MIKEYLIKKFRIKVYFTGQNIIKDNKIQHTSCKNSIKIFDDYVFN